MTSNGLEGEEGPDQLGELQEALDHYNPESKGREVDLCFRTKKRKKSSLLGKSSTCVIRKITHHGPI